MWCLRQGLAATARSQLSSATYLVRGQSFLFISTCWRQKAKCPQVPFTTADNWQSMSHRSIDSQSQKPNQKLSTLHLTFVREALKNVLHVSISSFTSQERWQESCGVVISLEGLCSLCTSTIIWNNVMYKNVTAGKSKRKIRNNSCQQKNKTWGVKFAVGKTQTHGDSDLLNNALHLGEENI